MKSCPRLPKCGTTTSEDQGEVQQEKFVCTYNIYTTTTLAKPPRQGCLHPG